MIFLESILIALQQLWVHKLRSILTLLGLLIGVGSVVGIVSISEGLRRMVIDEFGKIGGANFLFIMPQARIQRDGRWVAARDYRPLTLVDVERVTAASDRIEVVLPMLQAGAEVRFEKAAYQGELYATIPAYSQVFDWPLAAGRFLTERDLREQRRICVLGLKVKEEVFGERSPLGHEVKLNGQRYLVVGVMEARELFGQDWGAQVIVPVTTAQKRFFGNRYISGLFVYTREPEDASIVIPLVVAVLRKAHGQQVEYRVESGKGILDQVEKTILVMKIVTGGIAGISLLVGGIGIMNIMLVSVTERTREIGIRKALGAKQGILLLQFVVEAVVMSLAGGMLGVGAGMGLGIGISKAIEQVAEFPFPSVVSLPSVLLALGISVAIGLFFGIYPAVRAARLSPVDALGYE